MLLEFKIIENGENIKLSTISQFLAKAFNSNQILLTYFKDP